MKFLITLCLSIIFFMCTGQNFAQQTTVKNVLGKEILIDSIHTFLEETMQQQKVHGISLAIINNGKIVLKTVKGYADLENQQKVTNKTIFEGASLSKPLFAYFVMTFVEEGKLDLDKPLYEYLPLEDIGYDSRYKKITARMVLSHTTGFPNWRTDKDEDNGKLTIKFDPGTAFLYSGEGYQYLAKVLAHLHKTDDMGLEKIYQQKIAQPLGLQLTKYVQDDDNINHKAKPYENGERITGEDETDVFGAAFSIHSEAGDFSKWLIALLEEKGLSKESYNELFKAQVQLPEDSQQYKQGVTDWTLGFAKATLPFGTMFGHGGNNSGFTSLFALNKQQKWGMVIFTNADQSMLPLQLLMYLNNQ